MAKFWLLGAAATLLILLVAGVVVVLATGGSTEKVYPENTPEGVVQRFVRAMEDEDYRTAYSYLSSDLQARCPYDSFVRGLPYYNDDDMRITLESTRIEDDTAQVRLRITRFGGGPFGADEYSYDSVMHLQLEDGQWRFVATPGLPWPVGGCPLYSPEAPAKGEGAQGLRRWEDAI